MFASELYEEFLEYREPMLEIESFYTQLKERKIEALPKAIDEKQVINRNGLYYIQGLLCRTICLIEGVFLAANHYNPLVGILTVRAQFETTGALALLLDKLIKFHEGNLDARAMGTILEKMILGTRLCELIEDHEAPKSDSIMNYIDSVDIMLCGLGIDTEEYDFRKMYEFLSEFCHPNPYGLALTHRFDRGSACFSSVPSMSKREFGVITHLSFSLPLFMNFYDDALGKLRNA